MPLFPHQTLIIDSPLRPDEAGVRLAAHVEPRRWIRFHFGAMFGGGPRTRTFEGEVQGSRFTIRRIIRYQNSWRPEIEGWIEPAAQGSRIRVTLRLHRLVAVFMIVWLGAVGLITGTAALAPQASGDALGVIVPGLMFAFGCALTAGAFTWEAATARRLLADLFEATSIT